MLLILFSVVKRNIRLLNRIFGMIRKVLETQFTIRCSNEMKDAVEKSAQLAGQSVQEWARRALMDRIEKDKINETKSLKDNIKEVFYDPEFKTYLISILDTREDTKTDKNKDNFNVRDELMSIIYDPKFKKYIKENILDE